jgi:hypothetical protein
MLLGLFRAILCLNMNTVDDSYWHMVSPVRGASIWVRYMQGTQASHSL